MSKFVITSFLISLLWVSILSAQPQGAPGTDAVYPVIINPYTAPQSMEHNILSQAPERGQVPDPQLMEKIKNTTLPVITNDKSVVDVGKPTGDNSLAPIYAWNSWNGPNQNGWIPADVEIAAVGT